MDKILFYDKIPSVLFSVDPLRVGVLPTHLQKFPQSFIKIVIFFNSFLI